MTHHLQSLIPRLAGQRILVVGDVMLDEYVYGDATRISREAPIPVLEFQERRYIPGGAANPAVNIVALGSTAIQIGIIGSDPPATHLRMELQARRIETDALVITAGRPTTVKTRILARMGLRFPQQIARIDTLSREPINNRIEAQILEHIHNRIQRANAVLFSDYHTGMLTPSLVTEIRHLGRETGVLLTADTQGNLEKFRQFAVVKCNADDARSYLRRDIKEDDEFAAAARELYAALELSGCMVITRGADGATLCANGMVHHCPSPAVSDVYDTVGAGDTSIAVMTLAVAAGAPYIDAVTLANYASGIVVRHVGNYAPTPDELAAAVRANHPES